jgi:hypothetical protein
MGLIYEKSLVAFLLVTVVLGGAAAFMIGRAMALGWRPFLQAVGYTAILAAAVRFAHFGLFAGATFPSWRQAQGTLWSAHYYAVDLVVLLAFTALGFVVKRRSQTQRQYGWATEKNANGPSAVA